FNGDGRHVGDDGKPINLAAKEVSKTKNRRSLRRDVPAREFQFMDASDQRNWVTNQIGDWIDACRAVQVMLTPIEGPKAGRGVPKDIEMRGRAKKLCELIHVATEDINSTKSLTELLREAEVNMMTFLRSPHFKTARDDWESLKQARLSQSPNGRAERIEAKRITCRSCGEENQPVGPCPECSQTPGDLCMPCHLEKAHGVHTL
ncbi:MAG: hypothetical protein V3T70_06585, partial [Phycisphaerae bacterium]